jgi:signal transduction histidine kinase
MAEDAPGPAPPPPDWLGRLAHDLRNPITPMRSAVQLLQLGQLPPELAPDLLRTLDRQIDYLLRQIDDVADLVKIERGTFKLHRAHCDLGQVAASAIARHARAHAGRAAPVDLQAPPDPVWIDADEARLRQLVEVLLGFLGSGDLPSPATVVVERADGAAWVRLADGGRPLGPDARVAYLAGGPAPADASALSLDHMVVRRVVELHDARVALDATGTELSLRLPLGDPAAGS